MSSLRNSLHRRNHKERSQLSHRSKLGLLEKHKDYVLRARDYHSKQDRITRLRQKAADRNKDEFYFGMTNQRTEGGVHVHDRGNIALPVDMVKILKSQDENYVRTMRTANMKKIDNIKRQLSSMADLLVPTGEDGNEDLDEDEVKILQDAGMIPKSSKSKGKKRQVPAKHVVFVDNEAQGREYSIPTVTSQDQSSGLIERESTEELGWIVEELKKKRRKRKSAADQEMSELDMEARQEEATKNRVRLLKELSARLERDQQMRYAERELEMQKLLMGKGGSKKVQGLEAVEDENEEEGSSRTKVYRPRVYKWKPQRKR